MYFHWLYCCLIIFRKNKSVLLTFICLWKTKKKCYLINMYGVYTFISESFFITLTWFHLLRLIIIWKNNDHSSSIYNITNYSSTPNLFTSEWYVLFTVFVFKIFYNYRINLVVDFIVLCTLKTKYFTIIW